LALALVDARLSDGDQVAVDIRGRAEPFVLTKPPFLAGGVRA
jgi:aminomethyltransferase